MTLNPLVRLVVAALTSGPFLDRLGRLVEQVISAKNRAQTEELRREIAHQHERTNEKLAQLSIQTEQNRDAIDELARRVTRLEEGTPGPPPPLPSDPGRKGREL